MIKPFSRLCLSLLLVAILLIPIAGCIKIVQPESKPSTGDQAGTEATSQQEPSGAPADSQTPPSTPPQGSQSGATTASGQSTQSGQQLPPSQPAPSNQPTPPTQSQAGTLANWTGTWQCGNYKMYLSQTGNQVTGWHEFQSWQLEGYATGSTLVGTWSDSQGGSGDFQLDMVSGGNSLTGHYRFGSSGNWQGSWSCTRTSSATPPSQPSPPTQQVAPSQPQPTPLANWTGTWQCGNYKLYLSQTGNQLTGWYDYKNWDIQGYATGNTLVGTWSEPQGGSGDFQLNMSSDSKSFTGQYRTGSSGAWTGTWICTRTSTAQPPAKPQPLPVANWSGSWLCGSWGRLNLSQSGSTVTGTYTYQGGQFTGYATGTTLVGTWSEQPTYNPPDDAGDVQFNMSADGNSFTGYWRYGSSGAWAGTWNGQRDQ